MDAASATWHYVLAGERRGPVLEAELLALVRSGAVPRDALAWTEGMATWQPLQATRLAGALVPTPPTPPMPPPPAAAAFPPIPQEPVAERKSRIAYILLAVLVGFGVHNFYAGYMQRGVLQLVLWCTGLVGTVLCCGVGAPLILGVWIWGIVEACTVALDARGAPFQD
ncbi:MAG: hypothetical protein RL112_1738 [Planctomycetota bacterium]